MCNIFRSLLAEVVSIFCSGSDDRARLKGVGVYVCTVCMCDITSKILHHFTLCIYNGWFKNLFVKDKIFSQLTEPTFWAIRNQNQTIVFCPSLHCKLLATDCSVQVSLFFEIGKKKNIIADADSSSSLNKTTTTKQNKTKKIAFFFFKIPNFNRSTLGSKWVILSLRSTAPLN